MDPKTLIERIFDELINQGREDDIEALIAADYVEHAVGGDIVGRAGFRDYLQSWRAAFPDVYCEVQNVIIQGDLAAWMVRMTGTNSGPLMGMPATGKSVDIVAINMGRIRDGQAVEHWTGNDMVQLLTQLGALQLPQGALA